MIQLNKYNQSYNFDLKGHKIATFKNWVELQAWSDCIPKGCRDPKVRFCNKYMDLRKFKDNDSYSQTKFNEIYELQRSQSEN